MYVMSVFHHWLVPEKLLCGEEVKAEQLTCWGWAEGGVPLWSGFRPQSNVSSACGGRVKDNCSACRWKMLGPYLCKGWSDFKRKFTGLNSWSLLAAGWVEPRIRRIRWSYREGRYCWALEVFLAGRHCLELVCYLHKWVISSYLH